ncbi:hypothetical protein IFM89_024282 [Coptis chinensis]|uniref:HIT domain-containing protein n=1 Tax=Coptis chinensis TaxID=261450 RepID=A0A835HRR4_9MAGN|nr:hypothetical protein IFM89_024282 [Coptis chinensis]
MAGVGVVGGGSACLFCQIARSSTSTHLLHTDDKVVAFQDIKPAAFRHYLVIPVEHISTVKDLQRRTEDYNLGIAIYPCIVWNFIKEQLCQPRFGFHQPPFNSVNHLHLHCLALPFSPRWKHLKYMSMGPLGFIEAEKLLEKIKP